MCHIGGAQIVSSKSAATQESANWYVKLDRLFQCRY